MKKLPILLFLLFPLILFVQEKNIDEKSLAIGGYDLVSYFTQDNPKKGKESIALNWEGARFLFANQENKALFKKNPEKYLPAYGGWCAYAMVKGKEVEINPKAFHIQQGKLYLFYKTNWVDTRIKWIKNPIAYKAKADQAWAKKITQKN